MLQQTKSKAKQGTLKEKTMVAKTILRKFKKKNKSIKYKAVINHKNKNYIIST